MASPKAALERIRDHSVGTTADGPCIECEHMIELAKAAIPVAELHEQAVEKVPRVLQMLRKAIELIEQEIPDCETFKETAFIDSVDALLPQLEALKCNPPK